MKPVCQTKFGFENGNCGNACIASILEIPIEAVPDFFSDPDQNLCDAEKDKAYWRNVRKWCSDKPFMLVDLVFEDNECAKEFLSGCWCIAVGPSPRGTEERHRHAIVWKDGEIAHDPHPSRQGLKEIDTYMVFVVKDPSILLKKD